VPARAVGATSFSARTASSMVSSAWPVKEAPIMLPVGIPLVWLSRWRTVIEEAAPGTRRASTSNQGRYVWTGASRLNDLLAVHDAERDAGNVHRLHLRGDIGVDHLKVDGLGVGPAAEIVALMRRRRRKQKDA